MAATKKLALTLAAVVYPDGEATTTNIARGDINVTGLTITDASSINFSLAAAGTKTIAALGTNTKAIIIPTYSTGEPVATQVFTANTDTSSAENYDIGAIVGFDTDVIIANGGTLATDFTVILYTK